MDKPNPKTGLTGKQVDLIKKHWTAVWKDWETKHGVQFFMLLFKEYPKLKDYFRMFDKMSMDEIQKSDKLHAHTINFGNQFNALVEKLNNPDVLIVLIQKLAVNHYARSIDTPQFKDAFKCFLMYSAAKSHVDKLLSDSQIDAFKCFLKYAATNSVVDKPTAEAWTKCLDTITSVVDAQNRGK